MQRRSSALVVMNPSIGTVCRSSASDLRDKSDLVLIGFSNRTLHLRLKRAKKFEGTTCIIVGASRLLLKTSHYS